MLQLANLRIASPDLPLNVSSPSSLTTSAPIPRQRNWAFLAGPVSGPFAPPPPQPTQNVFSEPVHSSPPLVNRSAPRQSAPLHRWQHEGSGLAPHSSSYSRDVPALGTPRDVSNTPRLQAGPRHLPSEAYDGNAHDEPVGRCCGLPLVLPHASRLGADVTEQPTPSPPSIRRSSTAGLPSPSAAARHRDWFCRWQQQYAGDACSPGLGRRSRPGEPRRPSHRREREGGDARRRNALLQRWTPRRHGRDAAATGRLGETGSGLGASAVTALGLGGRAIASGIVYRGAAYRVRPNIT